MQACRRDGGVERTVGFRQMAAVLEAARAGERREVAKCRAISAADRLLKPNSETPGVSTIALAESSAYMRAAVVVCLSLIHI